MYFGAIVACVSSQPDAGSRTSYWFDTLIKELIKLGYPVTTSKERGPTQVAVGKDTVDIAVFEVVDAHELPAQPSSTFGGYSPRRYAYKRSGRLQFRINEYWPKGGRKSWSDGKTQRLEDFVDEIIVAILSTAEAVRRHRQEIEDMHRQWREAELRRQEEEKRKKDEDARRDALEKQASGWTRCTEIREFLKACEQTLAERRGPILPGNPEAQWLEWARQHVDRFDPFKNGYIR